MSSFLDVQTTTRRAEHAFLRDWDGQRPRRRPRHLGADEIHRGKALAAALYANGLLSFGKASELAGTSRCDFGGVLTHRRIARHYGQEELNEDSAYADGQ